jgi:uncharacterized protein YecE (DUF72 family)
VSAPVRIGCSSWTSEAWWGTVYPPGIPDGERLRHYARRFDTVEVDSTYYRPPSPYLVRGWAAKTPPGFLFALKMTRDLLDPKTPVDPPAVRAFTDASRLLGEKLGPILLQFPPWVKPGRAERFLGELLDVLDPELRYAVELRDAGWFSGEVFASLLDELRRRRIALAWSFLTYVDVPPELTTDFVYLRFIGDHETVPAEVHGAIRIDRSAETRRWADRLKERIREVRQAFVFFNNHFAGFAPDSAELFRRELPDLAPPPAPPTGLDLEPPPSGNPARPGPIS